MGRFWKWRKNGVMPIIMIARSIVVMSVVCLSRRCVSIYSSTRKVSSGSRRITRASVRPLVSSSCSRKRSISFTECLSTGNSARAKNASQSSTSDSRCGFIWMLVCSFTNVSRPIQQCCVVFQILSEIVPAIGDGKRQIVVDRTRRAKWERRVVRRRAITMHAQFRARLMQSIASYAGRSRI